MRLRRAVPKIPAKSSVPPRLPLHKNRSLRTRSESTLPQPLIPPHFKSFISNVYKKPGEGCAVPAPKFYNSSLPTNHPAGHAGSLTTPIPSSTSAHFPSPMGCTPLATAHTRSRPYLTTSLLLCFRLLSHSNKSGCSRVIRSHIGWNWNQPASGLPTCECVSLAVS